MLQHMSRWLARHIVKSCAWLAPPDQRARWREEWLAEVDNGSGFALLRNTAGAPVDALTLRSLARESGARRRFHFGQWRADLRYTSRLLLRSPGYVAIVVLGLSVGLTATIAMYSVANASLHGELPGITDRGSLAIVDARLTGVDRRTSRHGLSLNDFSLMREHGPTLTGVAAQTFQRMTLRFGDDAIGVEGVFASATLFELLGTRPVAGRLLNPGDDRADAAVAVIDYRFWQTHFGGRTEAIGQTILADGRLLRIVGVLPDQFGGIFASWVATRRYLPQVWLPLSLARDWPGGVSADEPRLAVAVRLAPGVTREHAERELAPLVRVLEAAHPVPDRAGSIRLPAFVVGDVADNPVELTGIISLVLAVPLSVLAIACANVANLRLARATARASEWAVRLSIGSTQGQLMRLMAIEAAILTTLALFVSWIGVRVLIAQLGPHFLAATVAVDARVASFAALLTGTVIAVSGLLPAWVVTRRATAHGLREAAQSGIAAHSRLRNTLVVIQVAVSLILLATGLLIARSAQFADRARMPMFDRLLVARLSFDQTDGDPARPTRFVTTLLQRLESDARFAGAGISDHAFTMGRYVQLRPPSAPGDTWLPASTTSVTPGWFAAMSLPAVVGRTLVASDRTGVAVVNEAVARAIAPGASPIGMTISLRDHYDRSAISSAEIVGVVGNSTSRVRRPLEPSPFVYTPLAAPVPKALTLFVREHRAADMSADVRRVIAGVEPVGPWTEIERAAAIADEEAGLYRAMAVPMNIVGSIALALAAAGLFAVMAYTVALRTREFGIRVALGAKTSDITRLVFRQALTLTSIGAAAGFAITIPLAYALRLLLLGVSPLDPVAIGSVCALLVGAAVLAGAIPARRAAAVDPVRALRAQ